MYIFKITLVKIAIREGIQAFFIQLYLLYFSTRNNYNGLKRMHEIGFKKAQ